MRQWGNCSICNKFFPLENHMCKPCGDFAAAFSLWDEGLLAGWGIEGEGASLVLVRLEEKP